MTPLPYHPYIYAPYPPTLTSHICMPSKPDYTGVGPPLEKTLSASHNTPAREKSQCDFKKMGSATMASLDRVFDLL